MPQIELWKVLNIMMHSWDDDEFPFSCYQRNISRFCIYPTEKLGDIIPYPVFGLAGESGEVVEVFKKCLRDNGGKLTPEYIEKAKLELGDLMFYVARIMENLNLTMDDVLRSNISKLQGRLDRDKLKGSGDLR